MNYREKIKQLLEAINQNEQINCIELKFGSTGLGLETSKDFYIALNGLFDNQLPEAFIDYIHIGDDWEVYWKSIDGKTSGEFDLISMSLVLFRGDQTQLSHDEMSDEEIEFYDNIQTIDIHGFSGDGQYAAFEFPEKGFPFNLWFIHRDARFQLDLDYGGYLDALIETRGLHGWQYFFLKEYDQLSKDDYALGRAKKLMENTLTGLKELFPEVDIEPFQAKYDHLFSSP